MAPCGVCPSLARSPHRIFFTLPRANHTAAASGTCHAPPAEARDGDVRYNQTIDQMPLTAPFGPLYWMRIALILDDRAGVCDLDDSQQMAFLFWWGSLGEVCPRQAGHPIRTWFGEPVMNTRHTRVTDRQTDRQARSLASTHPSSLKDTVAALDPILRRSSSI